MIQPSSAPHLQAARHEHEVLLSCAATVLDQGRRARLQAALAQGCDWDYLFDLAEHHGLLPLLSFHLNGVAADAVPAERLAALRERFRRNAISNLLLTSELRSILNRFEAAGINAIPFKGPTLAAFAYGDLALRQFRDLDLMMRREDVLKAKRLLVEQGYRAEHQLSPAQEAALLRSECEYTFKGSVYVELQWDIVPANYAFTVNDAALWQRAGEVDVEGVRLPMLAPEDLLLILCAHGTKHGWTRLAWICDVAETTRAAGIDWPALLERAQRLGGERMLLLGLQLAIEVGGARLPEAIKRRAAADGAVRRLAAAVYRRLFDEKLGERGLVEQSRFYIRARERAGDRARCGIRITLSPTASDVMAVKLPRRLFFLYYPLRPLRLGMKYGQHLLGRFARRRGVTTGLGGRDENPLPEQVDCV